LFHDRHFRSGWGVQTSDCYLANLNSLFPNHLKIFFIYEEKIKFLYAVAFADPFNILITPTPSEVNALHTMIYGKWCRVRKRQSLLKRSAFIRHILAPPSVPIRLNLLLSENETFFQSKQVQMARFLQHSFSNF